ncbi:MAG: hypothetical protein GWP91_18880 [Rhodobacterales bacterium]|nr:hypothetical protein [Rhodobacterales bacterium]
MSAVPGSIVVERVSQSGPKGANEAVPPGVAAALGLLTDGVRWYLFG